MFKQLLGSYHRVFAHCVKLLTQFLGCHTYPSRLCPLCEAVDTALVLLYQPVVSLLIVWSCWHSSWDVTLTHCVFAHHAFAHCVKLLKQLLGCYTYPSCLCQLCEAVGTALGILHLPILSLPIMSVPVVWSCWNSSWDVTHTHRVFAHRVKLSTQLLGCYTYPACLCPLCEAVEIALGML